MHNNEKGFIFPITLMMIFIVGSFLTFQIQQYMTEKQFLLEESETFTSERLLQMAVIDINQILIGGEADDFSGKFHYQEGEVTYIVKKETEEVMSITLVSKTLKKRSKHVKYYYYLNGGTVLPWLEERLGD